MSKVYYLDDRVDWKLNRMRWWWDKIIKMNLKFACMTSLALGILENKVEKDRNNFEIKNKKIINKITFFKNLRRILIWKIYCLL